MNFDKARKFIDRNASDESERLFLRGILNALEDNNPLLDIEPILQFQKGDIVEALPGLYYGNTKVQGKRGIVISLLDEPDKSVGVEFFEDVSGHQLDERILNEGHGWWMEPCRLRLIYRPTYKG